MVVHLGRLCPQQVPKPYEHHQYTKRPISHLSTNCQLPDNARDNDDYQRDRGDETQNEVIDFEKLPFQRAAVGDFVLDFDFRVEPAEEDGHRQGADGHQVGGGEKVEEVEDGAVEKGPVLDGAERQGAEYADDEDADHADDRAFAAAPMEFFHGEGHDDFLQGNGGGERGNA